MTDTTARTLDLSRIEAPALVPTDPETLTKQLLTEFVRLWNEARLKDPSLPLYDVDTLRSDPAVILTKEFVLGDVHLRQAINDTANALRLATAVGKDLDHLANSYLNTQRLVLDKAGKLVETDTDYRQRAQLALEAFPLFGLTPGGYIWRVKKLYGDRVKDVRALKRLGGRIDLVILARSEKPEEIATLIQDIQAGFEDEAAKQLTDVVTIVPARLVRTDVKVVLGIPPGPSPAPLMAAAREAILALATERCFIGETLHAQAIGAVAKVGPVRYVRVEMPSIDVYGGEDGVPVVGEIEVGVEYKLA